MHSRSLVTVAFVFGLLLGPALISGCGRSDPPDESSGTESDGADSKASSGSTKSKSTQIAARVENGRKWIGDIPYDVFFDDPIAIYNNKQQVPTNGTGAEPKAVANSTPKPDSGSPEPAKKAVAGANWKEIIDKEALDSEIKSIRSRLTQNLQTVGKFYSNYQGIPADSSTLAALAGIAIAHPDAVSWKQNAKYVRDLAGSMTKDDLKRDKTSYNAVKAPFEKIVDILNGSPPADLPDSPDTADFADVAAMGDLMKRLDRAERWFKGNARSEDGFKENGDKAVHEANIIAAIAKVISTGDYGYSDDEDFLGHANPMRESSRKMISAVKEQNFPAYEKGLSRVSQSCTQCHTEYRNN